MSLSTKWTVKLPSKKSRGSVASSGSCMPLEVELEDASLKQMKAMCDARGLSTCGMRKKLVARLQKYVKLNAPAPASSRFADWDCKACGAKGCFGSRSTCYKCGGLNPARRREGDWDCPSCKAHCFAGRTNCFKCGTQNPAEATVTLMCEHVLTGKGAAQAIMKAKTNYVVQENRERKQAAALQKFERQRKAAEKRELRKQRQVYAASSDSGSMTDTASVSSFVPDVGVRLIQDDGAKKAPRYFRGGKSYYLLRNGVVREQRELPVHRPTYGKGKQVKKNAIVTTLEAGTRVYVAKVVGYRAFISSPVRGWISTVTAKGDLLRQC